MSEARISAKSGTSYTGSGKYDLKQFTYPSNLFSNKEEYGSTWVMFNINVLEQSASFSEKTTTISDTQSKRWTNADARGQTGLQSAAALATSALAVGGAVTLTSRLSGTEAPAAGAKTTLGVAVAVGIPLAVAGTANRATKRLSAAIQLPMPNSLIAPYSVGWGEDNTKLFDLMMRAPGIGVDALKGIVTLDGEGISKAGGNIADVATSLALSANSLVGNAGVSAAAGLASNPKKEMFFDGVDFRTFTLEYRLYPKNAQESAYIKNIIDMFKYHMYPEYKSNTRFTFIYPSEFDITFFKGDGIENPWVTRIATSVLTNMSVNYTPSGVWAVHDDGSPVMVQLSLTFKELSIITKENLRNPYDDQNNTASY